jgi:tape measure domain-containing protein
LAITDMERLVVSLEARTKAAENQLKRAGAQMDRSLKKIEDRFAQANKKLVLKGSTSLGGGGLFGGVGGKIAGAAGAAFAANEVRKYADAWTEARNKIAAAEQVSGRQARSLSAVNKIATETRTGLTETVDLYAKMLRATKDVAQSEEEVARATEIVNKAFKAGGAAASEQAAGILQLSQALGSGVLQGDELRSLRENAPLLAQAIADEFQTNIAGLKALGAEGEITSDRVFKAILRAQGNIDKAFASTTATIGDSLTLLKNAGIEAAGRIGEVTGASSGAASTIMELVDAINALSTAFETFGKSEAGSKFLKTIGDTARLLSGWDVGVAILRKAGDLAKDANAIATGDTNRERAVFRRDFDKFFKGLENSADLGFISPEQLAAAKKLRKEIEDGLIPAGEAAKDKMAEIANLKPGTSDILSGPFAGLIDQLDALVEKAVEAKEALKSVGNPLADEMGEQSIRRSLVGDNRKREAFLDDRTAAARRSEEQKAIDARTKEILEAAEKAGVVLTEAAAKLQAANELGFESAAKATAQAVGGAIDLIKKREGFRTDAYWDRTAFRVGFGSDTATRADGTIERVTKDTVVTLADAIRDLERRIGEFQDGIRNDIGAGTFDAMNENQQAALTSIAYNYGSLPDRIIDAIKTGNDVAVYDAIKALGSDNGGINRDRRAEEAEIYISNASPGTKRTIDGRDRFAESTADAEREIELLNKQAEALGLVNPLIDDYGYATTKAEVKQRLLNDAMANGIEITPELAAKIDTLAEKYAKADANVGRLTESNRNLAETMSQSSAFGKDVLGGFISDLREGKSATEALANALNKVADKLLDVGLNLLFDGFGKQGGGGGLLGGMFSWLFPFADGGIARNGKPVPLKKFARGGISKTAAIFGETGRAEAAVPLPDGRRIPVDLNMQTRIPQRQAGSTETVNVVLRDDSGRMAEIADQQIRTRSGTIINVAVQQSTKTVQRQMPGMIADTQSRHF